MSDLNLDKDWGEDGAQLTGAQVQALIKSYIIELNDLVSALQAKMDAFENSEGNSGQSINQLNEQLQALVAKNDELNGKVASMTEAQETLQQKVQSVETTCSNLNTELGTLSETVTENAASTAPMGCEYINSLTSVPVDKNLYTTCVTANQSFSLASIPEAGREIHILVQNMASEDISVTLPTITPYYSENDTLTIEEGKCGEINAISDGEKIYIRSI